MTPIQRFLINLAAAFSKRLSEATIDVYTERLIRWNLTPDQWSKALSKIVADMEKWPSLSQIYVYLRGVKYGSVQELTPIFRTWRDSHGKEWAQRTGDMCAVAPSDQDIERWKREAVPVPAEMRLVLEFAAWRSSRGLPRKGKARRIYTHQEILSGAWHGERDAYQLKIRAELADFDDSPEAIGAVITREGI